ncbi:sodium channel subunit beta-4-like [Engraulis encrasicolus]|uniref:sodium channel subunit beta-4-like n=1 Tax=Engraulis encrasicolus TaxID=184585 RepID=UPI002FD5B673
MEPGEQQRRWFFHRCRTSGDMKGVSILVALLLGVWGAQALEMSVGKVTTIEAMNGSSVLLPCTYASCIGIFNLEFNWAYNKTDYMIRGLIPMEGKDARIHMYPEWSDRVEFVGNTKTNNNISIVLMNITFEDAGEYTCFGKNPKEKNSKHSATLTLVVVDENVYIRRYLRDPVDNTITTIIMSVVGAIIGLLVLVMAVKSLVTRFVLDKNKEPLVSSTANDNSENGLNSSKAEDKPKPKA